MYGIQRTSPDGSSRPDGLFMAIAHEWEVVHEADIEFDDVAARCAQLIHVRRPGSSSADAAEASDSSKPSELIIANVHLLFPHDEVSTRIRVREVHKLLSYLEGYKAALSRPVPSLICGDFNGEQNSRVMEFLTKYGWECSFTRHAKAAQAQAASSSDGSDKGDLAAADGNEADGSGAGTTTPRWVSHYTHEQQAVGVDYIWVLNPSRRRLQVPDWTDFVFSEMAQQLSRVGFSAASDAWTYFYSLADHTPTEAAQIAYLQAESESVAAAAASNVPLDAARFRRALGKLDFERGDALGTLTEAEVMMVIDSCDIDGDGCVDGSEWRERFASALRRLKDEALVADAADAAADLEVEDAAFTPRCLEKGAWPDASEWDLSDHGVLTSRFARRGSSPSS